VDEFYEATMKPDIHPEYRFVVFRDVSSDFEFLTKSCMKSREKTTFEGEEYPLVVIDISSKSHPFYTGTQKLLDTEGRVEKFYKKYGLHNPNADDDDEEGAAEEGAAAEVSDAEVSDAEVSDAEVSDAS
jgi:large subunit ribosomal protein L31